MRTFQCVLHCIARPTIKTTDLRSDFGTRQHFIEQAMLCGVLNNTSGCEELTLCNRTTDDPARLTIRRPTL